MANPGGGRGRGCRAACGLFFCPPWWTRALPSRRRRRRPVRLSPSNKPWRRGTQTASLPRRRVRQGWHAKGRRGPTGGSCARAASARVQRTRPLPHVPRAAPCAWTAHSRLTWAGVLVWPPHLPWEAWRVGRQRFVCAARDHGPFLERNVSVRRQLAQPGERRPAAFRLTPPTLISPLRACRTRALHSAGTPARTRSSSWRPRCSRAHTHHGARKGEARDGPNPRTTRLAPAKQRVRCHGRRPTRPAPTPAPAGLGGRPPARDGPGHRLLPAFRGPVSRLGEGRERDHPANECAHLGTPSRPLITHSLSLSLSPSLSISTATPSCPWSAKPGATRPLARPPCGRTWTCRPGRRRRQQAEEGGAGAKGPACGGRRSRSGWKRAGDR